MLKCRPMRILSLKDMLIPTEEPIWEGPFGDHTGYYSLPDWYPRFHITAITHKKNPVYPATIVGIPPQEDAWLGKATERIFLAPIKMTMVPEIIDMEMPVEGVFHNLVITQINKEYAGQGQKVMNAMWGAGQMMFNKILVLAGSPSDQKTTPIPLSDYEQLAQEVFHNLTLQRIFIFHRARWMCWTTVAANLDSAEKCASMVPGNTKKKKLIFNQPTLAIRILTRIRSESFSRDPPGQQQPGSAADSLPDHQHQKGQDRTRA